MHLSPDHTSELAEVLQNATSMPVQQVAESIQIEAGHVYVVPPGKALEINGTVLTPTEFENPDARRTPIDHFFRSLAQAPVDVTGVILSGSGSDGAIGLRAIEAMCGLTGVQDPDEATHSSMPRAAIDLMQGADFILPAAELAQRIATQNGSPQLLEEAGSDVDALDSDTQEVLRQIFVHVHAHTGQDFSQYKRPTMLRRIERRMQVHQKTTMEDYFALLKAQPAEAQRLKKEFLISVSNFFRNPDSFKALQKQVIVPLVARKEEGTPIRVWVPGCATGEEAYSLAILLLEACDQHAVMPDQIQIFASDPDKAALAKARDGRYPESIASDVPKRYRDTYFQKKDAWYTVHRSVRERIIFTPHDLLRDPPFSKLDLISCRNLLIYLRRGLQESVFKLFNYALNENGYLFLGSSESTGAISDLFHIVDKTHCIYKNGQKEGIIIPKLPTMPLTMQASHLAEVETTGQSRRESAAILHRRMLEAYAPPSAIVDEKYTIVRLSAGAGRYLEHPAGTPSSNIVEIVRTELQIKLQAALREAFEEKKNTRTEPVQVKMNGTTVLVRLLVYPAKEATNSEGTALVMFINEGEKALHEAGDTGADGMVSGEGADVEELQKELQQTRRQLHSTIEEHETSKQEMRAANEELRSMNEEYKSMTEELETSKEELQSVNEELKTVNAELESKVEELHRANNDLKNLIVATNIGTLFVDEELHIRRFTPPVGELFNIKEEDEGRSIGTFTNHLDYEDLEADARQVLKTHNPIEREVKSIKNEWFSVRIRPYRTDDDVVEGVVFTFVDITQRKYAELELRAASDRLRKRTRQVRSLSTALTLAEEHERERLSQILHDDLQQLLFAAQIRIENIQASENGSDPDTLEKIASEIRKAITTTRNLSSELNPPVGKESLCDALEWLSVHMKTSYGLKVALHADQACPSLHESVRTLLFRTTRELLFNVVKHAGVETARVDLTVQEDEAIYITVSDKGVGFDASTFYDKTEGDGGLGLFSIKERLEMIGGWFTVETTPGEGTETTIGVPTDTGLHTGKPDTEETEAHA